MNATEIPKTLSDGRTVILATEDGLGVAMLKFEGAGDEAILTVTTGAGVRLEASVPDNEVVAPEDWQDGVTLEMGAVSVTIKMTGGSEAEDHLAFLADISAFGGAMRARMVFKGMAGGVQILAPPGTGKSTLVKASGGSLLDADDLVFAVLKFPDRVSQQFGEQMISWQDKPEVKMLCQAAAHMALVKACITAPEFPVLSGWLPPPGLWAEVHAARTVVCIPSKGWLLHRVNSDERMKKGHFNMSDEQVGTILHAFEQLGREVENARAGFVLPPEVTEQIFSTQHKESPKGEESRQT